MTSSNEAVQPPEPPKKRTILHVCVREVLRPLRDQILRLSGFEVESTCSFQDALTMFHVGRYDLVMVDVVRHGQRVAFVCNWRVAILTDCPDEILRTEFDPAAFVAGVRKSFEVH